MRFAEAVGLWTRWARLTENMSKAARYEIIRDRNVFCSAHENWNAAFRLFVGFKESQLEEKP